MCKYKPELVDYFSFIEFELNGFFINQCMRLVSMRNFKISLTSLLHFIPNNKYKTTILAYASLTVTLSTPAVLKEQ